MGLESHSTDVLDLSSEGSRHLPAQRVKTMSPQARRGARHGAKTQVRAASLKLSHIRDPTHAWPSCYRSGPAGRYPSQLLMGHKEMSFT